MFDNSEEPNLLDRFKFLQGTLLHLTFKPSDPFSHLIPPCSKDTTPEDNKEDPIWLHRLDWFNALGVPLLYLPDGWYSRYLVFRQRQVPAIIVEFLFPGEEYSLLSKPGQQQPVVEAQIFQTNYSTPLGIRYFVVFNPTTNEMQRFEAAGNLFIWRESTKGHLLIKDFELILGTWFGTFRGMERLWLRWMTLDGEVIWTPEEEEGQ